MWNWWKKAPVISSTSTSGSDDRTYYYIAYSPGGLQVLSSNRNLTSIVFELKPGRQKDQGQSGTGRICLQPGSPAKNAAVY